MTARRLSLLLTLTLALLGARAALAGGFFEADGVALRGYDPVAYFTDNKPEKGLAKYAYEYKGSKFLFTSAKNKQAFAANPDKYAPQFGGFCAFGTAHGVKVSTQPNAFAVVDGKLYLNYDTDVLQRWKEDVPGNIALGEKNWPEVAKAPLAH